MKRQVPTPEGRSEERSVKRQVPAPEGRSEERSVKRQVPAPERRAIDWGAPVPEKRLEAGHLAVD